MHAGENTTSGALNPQDALQRSVALDEPADSAQKPSPAKSNPRRGSGSSFARASRSVQQPSVDESPVANVVEQAALQFPMSPGVPLIGFNAMRRESSRRRSSLGHPEASG